MKKGQSFHDHVVRDLLAHLPEITSRVMFGGWGLYQSGVIFGIIAGGELYFKVDDTNRADFERSGSQPFVYAQGNRKPAAMSYWAVPGEIMEHKEKLREWVERSARVSRRARRGK